MFLSRLYIYRRFRFFEIIHPYLQRREGRLGVEVMDDSFGMLVRGQGGVGVVCSIVARR